jgi:hypothetical protein
MKRCLMILFVSMLSLVLIMGCSKDKKDNPTASAPASITESTNANGLATLTLGSFTINATVQDSLHAGLANIDVSGYLTHNSVLLEAFDATGTYYPSITLTPLTTGKSDQSGRIQSPENIMVAATLILYPVQWGVMGLAGSGIDEIATDAWTTDTWHSGQLYDMYNIIDTVSTFEHGVFVNMSAAMQQATGAPFRTAVFLPSQISDFATFSSLAGYAFHIFMGDTLHFSQLSYSEDPLPIMHVDNVILNRDFWAQFTLSWGENPRDLDSHLWTPPIDSAAYHVYFVDHGDSASAPYAYLDVDDVSSYGPEHVTIYQGFPGTYTYAVYHWSGTGTLATSGASVSLLKPNGSVETFNVPTDTTGVGENWWWNVCTIDGTTGEITRINTLAADPPINFKMASGTKPY